MSYASIIGHLMLTELILLLYTYYETNFNCVVVLRYWNTEEETAALASLKYYVLRQEVPGKKACEECTASSSDALCKRSWTDVKYKVKNLINAARKH